MSGTRLIRALTLGVSLAAAACTAPPSRPPKLIFLVSIDTLRADHLGMYGYPLPTSPNLDRLREDGVLFRQAIAHAPSTLPSHASLLTSLLPQHHGASYALRTPLPEAAITLAERMLLGGYRTMAFVARGQLDPVFGLGQGFEWYKNPYRANRDLWPCAKMALLWLDRHPDQSAFFFLHTYQTHHPYQPGEDTRALFDQGYEGPLPPFISTELLKDINSGRKTVDDRDIAHIVASYDAVIRAMDASFGRLIEGLKKRGRYDDAMILLTSDHGEEFGEHGSVGWHSHTLYDELLRVPLLIKLPDSRRAGREVGDLVRSIDIAPTILDLAGLEVPAEFQGRSLRPLIEGHSSRPLPAISLLDGGDEATSSVRFNGYKLWDERLFDLRNDAAESKDLAPAQPETVDRLGALLQAAVDARPPLSSQPVQLGENTRKQLRALGYAN